MTNQLSFWKLRSTWVGAAMILVFQLVFSIVWMTGYSGVNERINQLKIGIVPMDRTIGADIASQLIDSLPFQTQIVEEESLALDKLSKRELQLAVVIPMGMAEQIQSGTKPGVIKIWVNESNPSLIKSAMQQVSMTIAKEVNRKATYVTARSIFDSMKIDETKATGMSLALSEMVQTEFNSTNKVKDTANQMIPMMLVLATYVGAMIMAMNIQQSTFMLKSSQSVWRLWIQRLTLNVGMTIVGSAFGLGIILLLGGQLAATWWETWLVQISSLFAFMLLSQLFLMAFGMAGMLFNIIALSLQLVTSGAIFPREMLSTTFQTIGTYLPATYTVEGTMNTFFGGPSSFTIIGILLLFAVVMITLMIVINFVSSKLQSKKAEHPIASTES